MGGFIDLTNQIFGRLTVLKRNGSDKDNRPLWECLCNCGNLAIIKGKLLRNGETKSCGCLLLEKNRERANSRKRKVSSILVTVYSNMKSRCYNPNNKMYYRYGGRGITICEEWLNSYENFYNDMINEYNCNYELDRIDNDGNYCKENCRWVSKEINIQNSSATKLSEKQVLEIRNSTKKTKELQKEFNMSKSTIKDIRAKRTWTNI
jgi:hypothetical protein